MVAPNDILGYYRIIERLGAGGMGEVWKAEDTRLGRIVAVKILPASVATDQEATGRMRREARTAAQISSPNIATIYSFEEIGERLFIVMEYVEGEPLTRLVDRGPLAEAELCRIGREVAQALAEAHGKGIIHRDIKPDNIIVNGPRVKVLDFGIAKQVGAVATSNDPTSYMTQQGMIIGTVQYMSPEQALGKPLDARTDIFSLGVVLYQAATGRLPFQGETVTETITQIVRDEPPNAGTLNKVLSPNITRIISRCLRKSREQRFESAADLASVLDAQLARATTAAEMGRSAAEMPFERRPAAAPTVMTGPALKTAGEGASRKAPMLLMLGAAALVLVIAAALIYVVTRRATVAPADVPVALAAAKPGGTAATSGTAVSVTAVSGTSAPNGATGDTTTAVPAPAVPVTTTAPESSSATAPSPASEARRSADDAYNEGVRDLTERRVLEARKAFLAAIDLDSHYAKAHMRLGELALFGREPGVARSHFESALADQDRLDARERALTHLGLAIANSNWDRARQIALQLEQANPGDPDVAALRRLVQREERGTSQPLRPRRRRP